MIKKSKLKLINIADTQQHPFHVLTNSKLPIIVATLAGSLAITFIAKIHGMNESELDNFSIVAKNLLEAFYRNDIGIAISPNIVILSLIIFIIISM